MVSFSQRRPYLLCVGSTYESLRQYYSLAYMQNTMLLNWGLVHFQVVIYGDAQSLGNKGNLGSVPMSLYPHSRAVSMTDEMICSSRILKVPTVGQKNKYIDTSKHVYSFPQKWSRNETTTGGPDSGEHPLVPLHPSFIVCLRPRRGMVTPPLPNAARAAMADGAMRNL